MLPGLGPQVVGASWTPYDGHANPLRLLHALHTAFVEGGGTYVPKAKVDGRSGRAARLRRHRRRAALHGAAHRPRRRAGQCRSRAALRPCRPGPPAARPGPGDRTRGGTAADADHHRAADPGGQPDDGRQHGGGRLRPPPEPRCHARDRRAGGAVLPLDRPAEHRPRLVGAAGHGAGRRCRSTTSPPASPAPSPPTAIPA